jgi:hypothetical protein
MKVGVKISGLASSLAADAVVQLRGRIEREEELWLDRMRVLPRSPKPRDRRRTRDEPSQARR